MKLGNNTILIQTDKVLANSTFSMGKEIIPILLIVIVCTCIHVVHVNLIQRNKI